MTLSKYQELVEEGRAIPNPLFGISWLYSLLLVHL